MNTNTGRLGQTKQRMQETAGDRAAREAEGFPELESGLGASLSGRILDLPLVDNVSSLLGAYNPLAHAAAPDTDLVWLLDNTAYRAPAKPATLGERALADYDQVLQGGKHALQEHLPHLLGGGGGGGHGHGHGGGVVNAHAQTHAEEGGVGEDQEGGAWQAEFVAAYFVKNTGKDVSKWAAALAQKIFGDDKGQITEEVKKTIEARLLTNVRTVWPARWTEVRFPDGAVRRLGPGGYNGISSQVVEIGGRHAEGQSGKSDAVVAGLVPDGPMETVFAEREGWGVISDIDDSIKITQTPSPLGLLKSTFVSAPTPIPGMPALYAHLDAVLHPTWIYLSASPYTLYPFLRPFLRQHYPPGTTILRDASWTTLSGLLESLTQGTEAYKTSRVEKVHAWLPARRWVCVGDSTQSDPEVYGAAYRRFGGEWVKKVFIRKVTDVAELNRTEKNRDERFEKAFAGVPRAVWRVFEDPSELEGEVEALVRGG